jgi:hypothetical protein
MQLYAARLCLDCQEIHSAPACPVCTSESFAPVSQWIPAQDRRARPRASEGMDAAETYRRLLASNDAGETSSRWLKRAAFVAAVGVGGWLWRRRPARRSTD